MVLNFFVVFTVLFLLFMSLDVKNVFRYHCVLSFIDSFQALLLYRYLVSQLKCEVGNKFLLYIFIYIICRLLKIIFFLQRLIPNFLLLIEDIYTVLVFPNSCSHWIFVLFADHTLATSVFLEMTPVN